VYLFVHSQKEGRTLARGMWLTPEEVQKKRERKKALLYALVPILGIILGTVVTLLMSYM